MQDFCPLCSKNGTKSKIKLLQINLEEAIWSCEAEKCIWPFGYENLSYFPRKIGKTWSCYWDDYTPKNQIQHEKVVSKETPAVVGVKEDVNSSLKETKDVIIKVEEHSNSNEQIILPDVNIPQSFNHLKIESINKKYIKETGKPDDDTSIIKSHDFCSEIISSKEETKPIIEIVDTPTTAKKNDKIQSIKPNQNRSKQITATTKAIPQIKSIKKTNINISNLRVDNQISVSPNNNKTKSLMLDCKNQSIKNKPVICIKVEAVSESSLNVTTQGVTEIPITLPSQVSLQTQINESATSSRQSSNNGSNCTTIKKGSLKALKAQKLQARLLQPIKKLSSGKEYEKFSFSAIKKQMEKKEQCKEQESNTNSSTINTTLKNAESAETMIKKEILVSNTSGINENFISTDIIKANFNESADIKSQGQSEIGVKSELPQSMETESKAVSIKVEEASSVFEKSEPQNNQEISLNEIKTENGQQLNTTLNNTSASLDIVLDELLDKDYSISEHISDDWISSLLH